MSAVRVGIILTHPAGDSTNAYIYLSFKRWFEAAGATVVPIPPNISTAEAAAYFEYIHGLALQPGWADQADYARLISLFLSMAAEANRNDDYFPVWGICQGFQYILRNFGGELEPINSLERTSVLHIQPDTSRLLRYPSDEQIRYLKHSYAPHFNHEFGISLSNFMKNKSLRKAFRIISTSHDREGKEYVSMVEGVSLPFYGLQFHPELGKVRIQWMAAFFISEMRKSGHTGFNPGLRYTLRKGICGRTRVPCLQIDL